MRWIAVAAMLSLAACTPTPAPEAEAPSPSPPAGGGAALDGSAWKVFEIGGQGLVADSAPTLSFAEGRLSGTASCNRFMGDYTLDRGKGTIRTGQMASTMMACPEPLMQQEDRYLRLLGRVSRYRVEGEVLTLSADDGQAIRARK